MKILLVLLILVSGCVGLRATIPTPQGNAEITSIRPIWTNYELHYVQTAEGPQIDIGTKTEHIDAKAVGGLLGTLIGAAVKAGIPIP